MADKRISQLIERTDIANNDVLPIVASGATTTNKVTISTIQDWMQDNLDVGVTSVGITLGTSGTDVNVSGSPITTSGNITINIPDASASARGVVTTGSQTFGGVKTFSNGLSLPAVGGSNQITRIVNIGTLHEGTASLNQIGFNSGNNIYFGKGLSNGGVLGWNNSTVRYYTLPDADGTLALASQLDGYVTLGTPQTITGGKTFTSRIFAQDATFSNSGSSSTMALSHSSGSGIALDISKGGNGEGLRVTKTSGSGNAVTISGGALVGETGLFSGDLQSATRVIAAASSQSIILTPNLGGTTNRVESVGTLPLALVSAAAITMAAGGTTPQITLATTGNLGIGTSSPAAKLDINGGDLYVRTGGAIYANTLSPYSGNLTISLGGSGNTLQVTGGAATFSGSVTAGGNVTISSTTNSSLVAATNSTTGYTFIDLINNGASGRNYQIGVGGNGAAAGYANNLYFDLVGSGNIMTLTSGRNVGIGTASPGGRLHVQNGTSGQTISNITNLVLENNGTANDFYVFQTATAGGGKSFSITNAGNVGIGTASPPSDTRLTARATSSTGYNLFIEQDNGLDGFVLASTSAHGALTFSRRDTSGTNTIERMRITAGGFLKASNSGSYWGATGAFHENVSNSTGSFINIFNHSGSDPYGTFIFFTGASPNNTTNIFLRCADSTTNRLIVYSNGNVLNSNGSYGSFSDIKLKENIKDATPKLEDLLKVKVRNYNLIGEETKQIGVIAQELEEVFPGLVDESEDFEEVEVPQLDEEGNEVLNEEGEVVTTKERLSKGTTTKSVKYSVFVPMLIKAIQEQQEIINEMRAEIDSLKTK